MREELVECVLRVVRNSRRVATYGMTRERYPRVVGDYGDWGGGVLRWRVVSVHGTFPTTVRGEGFSEQRVKSCGVV